jgi:hypothetical protein
MLAFLFLACATHVSHVEVLTTDPGHYLIFDADGLAYDCKSAPVEGTWKPTCVRVEYRGAPLVPEGN